LKNLSLTEIKEILPCREPFLFINEVSVTEEGKKAVASKKLTGNEYFFEGHFPGRPVMPGVLIVEAIAQTARVILGKGNYGLKKVENIKFRQTVEPQDTIKIETELVSQNDDLYEFSAQVFIDKILAASGNIILKKKTEIS